MGTKGFLGIDAGTQGLSVIFTNESMETLATGDGYYDMVPDLAAGNYEQQPADWTTALAQAMKNLRANFAGEMEVLAIGVSGQMHGEVLCDDQGNPLGPARLWCDSRNEAEEVELTEALGVKMPKRITAARWLWTVRNKLETAKRTCHLTTPSGYLAFKLTGKWNLGVGDASGMFPIDQASMEYDAVRLSKFETIVGIDSVKPLREILPSVCRAGEEAGTLDAAGAELLGLTSELVGIPVAAAEGDQPAALAGSLIAEPGMVSVSFGTSVCANSVGDHAFEGVDKAVDHFCAVDGKPINMVFLRNGTTFMNAVVEMFGGALEGDKTDAFNRVMPLVQKASPDCGGVLALPFMDDEPGLGVGQGGSAMLTGLNADNATPGNAVKAALLSTMFNLRLGSNVLDQQNFHRKELILTGGLTKTPELGQVLADVFDTPVTLLESAEEGTAWGAALLAKYRFERLNGRSDGWASFVAKQESGSRRKFTPDAPAVEAYSSSFNRYKSLLKSQAQIFSQTENAG